MKLLSLTHGKHDRKHQMSTFNLHACMHVHHVYSVAASFLHGRIVSPLQTFRRYPRSSWTRLKLLGLRMRQLLRRSFWRPSDWDMFIELVCPNNQNSNYLLPAMLYSTACHVWNQQNGQYIVWNNMQWCRVLPFLICTWCQTVQPVMCIAATCHMVWWEVFIHMCIYMLRNVQVMIVFLFWDNLLNLLFYSKFLSPPVFCLASARDKKRSAKWKRKVNWSMRIRTNCTHKRQRRRRKASPRKPKEKVGVGLGVGGVAGLAVAVGRRIQGVKTKAQRGMTKLAPLLRLKRNLLRLLSKVGKKSKRYQQSPPWPQQSHARKERQGVRVLGMFLNRRRCLRKPLKNVCWLRTGKCMSECNSYPLFFLPFCITPPGCYACILYNMQLYCSHHIHTVVTNPPSGPWQGRYRRSQRT